MTDGPGTKLRVINISGGFEKAEGGGFTQEEFERVIEEFIGWVESNGMRCVAGLTLADDYVDDDGRIEE